MLLLLLVAAAAAAADDDNDDMNIDDDCPHLSGWTLNMVIGVDFTGSNGNPAEPGSLHYRAPAFATASGGSSFAMAPPNQYEEAILSLGKVVLLIKKKGTWH